MWVCWRLESKDRPAGSKPRFDRWERTMSDELLARAMFFQRQGCPDKAEALYLRVLHEMPHHPAALEALEF